MTVWGSCEPVSADPYTRRLVSDTPLCSYRKTAQHAVVWTQETSLGTCLLNLEPGMGPEPLCNSLLTKWQLMTDTFKCTRSKAESKLQPNPRESESPHRHRMRLQEQTERINPVSHLPYEMLESYREAAYTVAKLWAICAMTTTAVCSKSIASSLSCGRVRYLRNSTSSEGQREAKEEK